LAEKLDPKEVVGFKDFLLSNMYEIQALINFLDEKGFITKSEVFNEIEELMKETPQSINRRST
jgi:hypothetical protein